MKYATKLVRYLALGVLLHRASATVGFTTYKEIDEGKDNSGEIAYSELFSRSSTLFLYIQITPDGADHADIIDDFKTLARNFGSQGVSVIPRVRYGWPNNTIATEPEESILMNDVSTFATVFQDITGTINIPVIQAGFLGEWGEWHDGQYCQAQGMADTAEDLAIKANVVNALLSTGHKVALRYPADHQALFNGSRAVTIHDDCIFDGGFNGSDGGTWPSDDRQTWIDYIIEVAGNNTFGGEGCDNAGDATFDWSDYTALCGSDGIAAYIDTLQIAYMNYDYPTDYKNLIEDSSEGNCVDAIQAALESWN
ncbi:hypothetical protein DPV78_001818 [Talaromyces pinophilus]|nr:hypothetical protein DPV78_001818 [Talaromyces pinophilus]